MIKFKLETLPENKAKFVFNYLLVYSKQFNQQLFNEANNANYKRTTKLQYMNMLKDHNEVTKFLKWYKKGDEGNKVKNAMTKRSLNK